MNLSALPAEIEAAVTAERLRLLSLGFIISGIIGAVMVSFLLIHLAMLTAFSFFPETAWNPPPTSVHQAEENSPDQLQNKLSEIKKNNAPPVAIFRIFAGVIGFVILIGWTLGGLTIYAGLCIKKRKHRTFVLVMSGINCIWVPHGTLLGIASFMTLLTPQAQKEYP